MINLKKKWKSNVGRYYYTTHYANYITRIIIGSKLCKYGKNDKIQIDKFL